MKKNNLENALGYAKIGWNIFPCHSIKNGRCSCLDNNCKSPGKHPRISNGFKGATRDRNIIKDWWEKWPSANIGCATGKISKIVVLDLDAKHDRSSKEFTLPITPSVRTGGGGEHFFFKHPGGHVKSSNGQLFGQGVDIKADDGYVILAPSSHASGNFYEWMVEPEDVDIADLPDWLKKALDQDDVSEKQKLWQKGADGVEEGKRNETAISVAGKIRRSTPPELMDTAGWGGFAEWNKQNTPPLLEKELRQIWRSLEKYGSKNDKKKDESKTQAEILLGIILGKEGLILFHDEKKDAYISLKVGDHVETMGLKSKALKRWATKELWDSSKIAVSSETLKSVIGVLEGKACFEGPLCPLYNRLAWYKDELWYDLTNDKWQAVKVTEMGWNVVDEPPILFNRYFHNDSQIIPSKEGDIRLIFKYVNITDQNLQLLLLVYLVSCFIPEFPHPILIVFGSQGSAKSTLSKLLRRIVDPSQIDVASMPDNAKELIQALAHHTFLFFDNVSYVSESVSDILCKAITGSGFVKRELYTDDEDIIYHLKRCIGINGINLVANKPDLLDRSILMELERIPDSQRKQEKELMENFEKDLPLILGDIFTILSRTLKLKSNIEVDNPPRMADFAIWGSAIAEALGSTQQEFMNAYQINISKQTETILNENTIAMVLLSYMEERSWKKWEGTASDLLQTLTAHAEFSDIPTYDKYWPKAPNVLSRALNVLRTTLRSANIVVTILAGQTRKITIEKILSIERNTPVTNSLLSEDASDDVDGNSQ